jgi:adenylyltransferase/sulfurtransferase
MQKTELNSAELSRYSRQTRMPEIGEEGQLKLTNSHVVIFGLGGLGSPASLYLTATGVGKITLVDFDKVDDSNLQRQIVHKENNIGQDKVSSAKENLSQLNHLVELHELNDKLNEQQAAKLIQTADAVLDCTDNFASRFALNRICHQLKKPLISGAAIRWEGQLTTYDFRLANSPCYQCLYKEGDGTELNCQANGILSPVVGLVGSMQAIETIKALIGIKTLVGKLLILDSYTMQFRQLKLNQDENCPICNP